MPVSPRPLKAALLVVTGAALVAALLPGAPAVAEDRSGVVTVSLPARIVIDGGEVPILVRSDALDPARDRIDFDLLSGDLLEDADEVRPNEVRMRSTAGWDAGALVGRAGGATTDCAAGSSDPCRVRQTDGYRFSVIDGLTYVDSAPSVAKFGSRVSLSGKREGAAVVWTARAERYDGGAWVAFRGARVVIGGKRTVADRRGVATWTERAAEDRRYEATVEETSTVWPSTSAVAAARTPALSKRSSAAAVARAMRSSLPHVTEVEALTRRTDPNGLLGRPNGYSSAAVLHDDRATCSDGPGADCGATIERWPSASKAKARSRYILAILDAAPSLGSERHTVHGRFLLRVTGELSAKQAAEYRTAFSGAF